jgi:hypothetical protein
MLSKGRERVWRGMQKEAQRGEGAPRTAVAGGHLKVKLSLCLTKCYVMKTYRGSGCIDPCFLDLGTSWR